VAIGGVAGGEKYIVNGILFKVLFVFLLFSLSPSSLLLSYFPFQWQNSSQETRNSEMDGGCMEELTNPIRRRPKLQDMNW
jgi:hypothetical protein